MTAASGRPRALLFDLDDTLWPVAPVLAAAEASLHAWLAQHAPAVAQRFSIDDLRRQRLALLARQPQLKTDVGAWRRAGLLAAFAAAGEDTFKVEAAMAHFLAARSAVTLYPDVGPGLLRLRQMVALGSISNGNADLETIGLAHHFQVSLAAGRFGRAKPDPAIFHAACAALDVTPQQAVYVGDDLLLDVAAAQAAGLRALWLRRADGAPAQPETAVRPDAVCATLHDVVSWLERQWEDSCTTPLVRVHNKGITI